MLHRKRPHLIPMLDSVLVNYYLDALESASSRAAFEDAHELPRLPAGVGSVPG